MEMKETEVEKESCCAVGSEMRYERGHGGQRRMSHVFGWEPGVPDRWRSQGCR